MSTAPAPALAASVSLSPEALSVTWARVIGAGSIRRDFGHHIATNPAGEVVLAARLDRAESVGFADDAPFSGSDDPSMSPHDLTTGRLIKLARGGGPAWSLLLRDAGLLGAPCVALDDAGAVYVAGPYTPDDAGLRGVLEIALTKLGPDGHCEWTRPLLLVKTHEGRPYVPPVRVAADPGGGACATWITERRGTPVVRAIRVSLAGSIEWEYAWPITGRAVEPHVGVEESGAAMVWGTFEGQVSFAPGGTVASRTQARYLARVEIDGRVSWAHAFRADRDAPHAIGVGRGGTVALATVVSLAARRGRLAGRAVVLMRLNAAGAPLESVHGACEPHSLVSSLSVAPLEGDAFALAGFMTGGLVLGGRTLRGPMQASEAVVVARVGQEREISASVLPMPQLSGGLSVHGVERGAVVVAGWTHGVMTLGEHTIASPADRAVLFLAKLT